MTCMAIYSVIGIIQFALCRLSRSLVSVSNYVYTLTIAKLLFMLTYISFWPFLISFDHFWFDTRRVNRLSKLFPSANSSFFPPKLSLILLFIATSFWRILATSFWRRHFDASWQRHFNAVILKLNNKLLKRQRPQGGMLGDQHDWMQNQKLTGVAEIGTKSNQIWSKWH